MSLPFESKAERKAENILRNYDYCLVTPLKCVDFDSGDVQELDPIKCTDIDSIRELYDNHYDVMIQTPDGCNY